LCINARNSCKSYNSHGHLVWAPSQDTTQKNDLTMGRHPPKESSQEVTVDDRLISFQKRPDDCHGQDKSEFALN
jgi:hypothetical protein